MSCPPGSAEARTALLPPHARSASAFTLIELLVHIAIISSVICLILPAVRDAQLAARQADVRYRVSELYRLADQYREDEGRYPSTAELGTAVVEYCDALAPDPCFFRWDKFQNQINDSLYDYYYTVDYADRDRFRLCARPMPPYRDGSSVICVEQGGEVSEQGTDAEAAAAEAARREEGCVRSLETVADRISRADDPDAASYVKPFLQLPEVKALALEAPDENQDGIITKQEIEGFFQPRETDNEMTLAVRAAVRDSFYILQLDRGEYEGVAIEDIQGDPTILFSPDHLKSFIRRRVRPELVESLQAKVVALDRQERLSEDDPDRRPACIGIVGAFRNEVWAQAGKAVSVDNAILLDALVGVLCPPKELPD